MTGSLIDLAGLQVGAEDFLAAVLDSSAQPIWVVDPDGVIRFANSAAVAALGYDDPDELLGRRHETIDPRRTDGSRNVSVPIELPDGRWTVFASGDRLGAEQVRRDAVLEAQQAALRRVATLVAGGAASADVFAAIAREVGAVIGLPLVALWRYEPDGSATVIGAWGERPHPFLAGTRWPLDGPTICARVLDTGRPARIDDFAAVPGTIADAARGTGIRGCAGAPIIVDGEVWGAMSADATEQAPLPADVEARLAEFTELVATSISSSASREEIVRLADEQAALRRVATLVANGVPSRELLAAVAREVGLLVGGDATHIGHYEPGGTARLIASWSRTGDHVPLGTVAPTDGENVCSLVLRTGRPARMDSYEDASGPIATMLRGLGIRASVGAPIVVDGRRWGVTIVSTRGDHPLPERTERRIAAFTELVATAIANAEARAELARLADEQAALRRVATLVAQGGPPSGLLGTVVEEAGKLLGGDLAGMIRYVTDDSVAAVAVWAAEGEHPEVPGVWPLEGDRLATAIKTTGRPAREDEWAGVAGPIAAFVREQLGIRSSVGGPIVVQGSVWGALFVHSTHDQPLPPETESRVAYFTELVAMAMANAEARADLGRLADEQAALRRVATLVAEERPPEEVFATVAAEVGRLLPVEDTAMLRYEDDGTATVVASWGARRPRLEVGARVTDPLRSVGTGSAVGCPIVAGGRLWGVMVAAQGAAEPLPVETEGRIGQFTELIATAISNVHARSELAASRARIVAAADEERRRVVRDLHDGAQQRLVHTIVTLQLARQEDPASELVREALAQAQRATVELRELAQGILPAILTQGGLRAALEGLASRTPVPVEVSVSVDRLPAAVEATAYFVVSEALTNVAKHSRANGATVLAREEDGVLRLRVRDDGVGGARPDGSGLVGLADRLAALDGEFRLESPPGRGTLVAADIPVPA